MPTLVPGEHRTWNRYETPGAGYLPFWASYDVVVVRVGPKRVLVDVEDHGEHRQCWVNPRSLFESEWFVCTMDDPVGFFSTKRAAIEHLSICALDRRKHKGVKRIRSRADGGGFCTFYEYSPPTDGIRRSTWYIGHTKEMQRAGWGHMIERGRREKT